ncbi:predicted protein [Naegleria gruberi]|uniref:Predicted protein n=1 Tax=Naegleria gruberi TaxID=5762 RepID=D2VZC0_NAEGR|nr:uncharacterized protein NAEGRDRAFT_59664 [Naegleria gruberi]EFC37819.1 predicted protein [Naegleria gruberi]|eukprot:XP_002670563.1 predicted protein [Naegleria gruberi strain NEG-M]
MGPTGKGGFHASSNFPFIKSQYYLIIVVYIIIICTCFYYIQLDDFQISSLISVNQLESNVFKNSSRHIETAFKPALGKLAEKTKTVRGPVVFASLIIAILTYIVMNHLIPILLNYWVILDWRKNHTEKDELQNKSREIEILDSPTSSGRRYSCKTHSKSSSQVSEDSNYISTTTFDIQNSQTITIVSFIYATFVYLSQPIQIWCLIISFVQLFVFHTGKSFYPLAVFTLFIAIVETKSQLTKWKTDKEKNERRVRMATGGEKQRGQLKCGDEVLIGIGEELPADLILTDIIVEDTDVQFKTSRKPILYMNEVTVTGENDPVKKCLLPESVHTIKIDNLLIRSATVNSKYILDESYIVFANSMIASVDQKITIRGIVAWSGTETKALHSSGATTSKQATPFQEYTQKGFFISLALMLFLSIVNTIASSFFGVEGNEEHSFGKVLITQIMYINMMVPQGLEQLRTTVCHLLSFNFRSGVKCNNSLASDVIAYVNRIISDKTGTLTVNLMQPKYAMLFLDEEDNIINFDEHHIIYEHDVKCEMEVTKCHKDNCFAIFSTTGVEPEERAIRKMVSPYSNLVSHWPIDSQDIEPGFVEFETLCSEKREKHHLKIISFFGFTREYLCKSCLVQDANTGEYYVSVQAGDELFWRGETGITTHPSSIHKIEKWTSMHQSQDNDDQLGLGAPRTWSHGIKKITESEAKTIMTSWRDSFMIKDNEKKTETQLEIVKDALKNIKMTSITYMVDRYRDGVKEGIKQLTHAGKQFCICTGDSYKNAKLIATHLSLPNHINICGSNERELLESLENADEETMNGPSTFFFDRSCMEYMRTLYASQGSNFKGPVFEKLLDLINMKNKKNKFVNSIVFCRSTPGLKLWCVKLLQHYHSRTLYEKFFHRRNYVLAMGDGTNDLQMLRACDISYGVKSGETEDVCKQADIWSTEWEPVLDLLAKDGLEKAIMLSTMVKATFWKHWCFALALWSDLIFQGFPLYPKDPTDPMLMLVFNGVVFGQIASHVSSDLVSDFSQFKKTNMMSMRAFLRWVFGASMTAMFTDWIIRWFFPSATSGHFGAYVQVSQAVGITIYLYLTTNTWSDDEEVITFQNQLDKFKNSSDIAASPKRTTKISYSRLYLSIFCAVATFAISLFINKRVEDQITKFTALSVIIPTLGYPAIYLFKCFVHDLPHIENSISKLKELEFSKLVVEFVKFSHTPHMRVLPVIAFSLLIKILSGIPVIGAVTIMTLSGIATVFTFLVFVSRMGFMRALLDGRSVAVGLICFLIGIWVGRSSKF